MRMREKLMFMSCLKKQSIIKHPSCSISSTCSSRILTALVLLVFSFRLEYGNATDIITSSQSIKDPEAIVSNGNIFKLGFFSPANSTNRYVGIWYNKISAMEVIWVANRNKPLKDSSGSLTISEDGNLLVLNGQKRILWSSNVSNPVMNSSARLLDTGNLVLQDISNGISLWESFQQPSDTFLPKMRLTTNVSSGEKVQLTSWKSPSDPSIGSFSAGIDPLNIPELFIWNNSNPYGRTGPWNGRFFIGISGMNSGYLEGFDLVDDKEGYFYFTFSYADKPSALPHFILDSQGKIVKKSWDDGISSWQVSWTRPKYECDVYGKCGDFGICNARSSPICSCLRGFEPKNAEEWNKENWTSGCVRKKALQCDRINNGSEVGKEDEFLKVEMVQVPDFAEWSSANEDECKSRCLNSCYCIAYAYYTGIDCMSWLGDRLVDIKRIDNGGADLYIRLSYSDLDKKNDKKVTITIALATMIIGTIIVAICTFYSWRWIKKHRASKTKSEEMSLFNIRNEANAMLSGENMLGGNLNQVKLSELPLFKFEKLATATNNFDLANKLGQGGFGPVYKGKFPDGREIAVKRLSKASGQGLEEFMNEVVVISKLQHRNLVRLLGCCVEGEEKMLVYEYMPNKSLDAFLFDPLKQDILDWRKRFNIIEGISRGLFYLHRDSRLKIIHRDLKASNILLDDGLNPKISDFGMARIFGGTEDQANTRRVVGTYGYMSPEYAMEGRFSEKSDVFSFGVLLLEIVSGRRNTSFHYDEQDLSLLGYVWKLWNEDNIVALIHPVISDPCFQMEIMRCIHVGLLCVQEFAKDRPSVSLVISMLNSEIADLPTPKQPAFTERQFALNTESYGQSQKSCSNNLTISTVGGR